MGGCKKQNQGQAPIVEKHQVEKQIQSQIQNQNDQPQNSLEGWNDYENEKYGYQIKYPPEWFIMKDPCCPPPPAAMNFNNYSELKLEYSARQFDADVYGLDILCLYEGKLDDIGEVELQKEEDVKNETKKINGFNAIIFTKDQVPGDSSIQVKSYYIVDGTQGCRITHSSKCPSCENIVQSFQFK